MAVKLSKENQSFVLNLMKEDCERIIKLEKENFVANNETRCPTAWDQVACWNSTLAGETAYQKCPDYIHNFLYDEYASKTCNPDGKWFVKSSNNKEWTNYTRCVEPRDHYIFPYMDHVPTLRCISLVGYSLSLAALVVAIFIMVKFKKLRCARNTLHLNLFASFVWRALVSLSKSFLLFDGTPLLESLVIGSVFTEDAQSWHCRMFTVIFNFGMVSNYSWIFVEGMYLHTLIFVAFFSETSGVYGFVLFGWLLPLVTVLCWAVIRVTFENTGCWIIHPGKWSVWVIKGPLLVTVLLNFFFFINIIRVLFTKLQSVNLDSRRHRHMKLAKSSLVLIPLFGVPYVVFLALNENTYRSLELSKLYFEMIFNSFNGLIVACLYCFFNGEVKAEVAKKWRRSRMRLAARGMSNRRTTMTRSMNSNLQGVVHSNSYDTTALQDDTVEDVIKNNGCKTDVKNNHNSKKNSIELKCLNRIRGRNTQKKLSQNNNEILEADGKMDNKDEERIKETREEIDDDKEFDNLLMSHHEDQIFFVDKSQSNLTPSNQHLPSRDAGGISRVTDSRDDDDDDVIGMEKLKIVLPVMRKNIASVRHNSTEGYKNRDKKYDARPNSSVV